MRTESVVDEARKETDSLEREMQYKLSILEQVRWSCIYSVPLFVFVEIGWGMHFEEQKHVVARRG
jgi:hypothetical protein